MKYQETKYLPLIWYSLLILVVVLGLAKLLGAQSQVVSYIAVFVHACMVISILSTLPPWLRVILIWAYIARIIFLIWDLYARHIFVLPNSGFDSEMYFHFSQMVSKNPSLFSEPIRGGYYAKLTGLLFNVVGPQRMFVQYINVLVGIFVVVTIYKILVIMEISHDLIRKLIFIAAFFPNSMVMSSIFLREISPTLFVTLSLYYFIKWYKWNSIKDTILSMVMLGIASMFHSGVIGIFAGYAFFYLFYKKDVNGFRFSSQTVVAFLFIGGTAFVASTQFGDALFGKFSDVENVNDVLRKTNYRAGGAAYLTGLTLNSPGQLVMYSPIKAFFFLTSPLPMNWRGFMDIFSFAFDSLLYLWVIFHYIRNKKRFSRHKSLITGIVVILTGVSIMFGLGVSNSGTAIRHRQKILPIFLVLSAVILEEKRKAAAHLEIYY